VTAVALDHKKKTRRKHPFHIEAIHQPAGKNLAAGVRPKESREQNAELRGRDAELVLDQGRRDREIAAIDVIDEDGKEKQNQHPRESRRQPRIVTFGRHGLARGAAHCGPRPARMQDLTCLSVVVH
jgi:hypothetical protein